MKNSHDQIMGFVYTFFVKLHMGSLFCLIIVARMLLSECSICLTWKIHDNILRIRCQTSKITARISFYDQYNHEQAYCVLPYKSSYCISYNLNWKIYQNLTSKETFIDIRDTIDDHLNGRWSCHYGRNLGVGYVNVKIIKEKVFQLNNKDISITGSSIIKTGSPLWLSCFSNIPLTVKKVHFLANDNRYITINKDLNTCRSSTDNGVCKPDQCHCSEDGHTYFVKHEGFMMADNGSLQCKMEFELELEMTDCIIVNAIDLDKPTIIQDKKQPFFASDQVNTVCYSLVKGTNLQLDWDCFNLTPVSTSRNKTLITSTLTFQVMSFMHNKKCTCKASYKKLESSTTLTITVSKAPSLELINRFVCNQSKMITVVCNAKSELPVVHFLSWIHNYNKIFIRFINGTQNSSTSTIKFDVCNFEDEGEYVCQAESSENGLVFLSNISTNVVVIGPPHLGSTNILEEPVFKVSVQVYSTPPPTSVNWSVGKNTVKNTTRFAQTIIPTLIQRDIHGKFVLLTGYTASLRITNYSLQRISTISISVHNEFGNLTKYFVIYENNRPMTANLNVPIMLSVIFGMLIMVVTIAVALILFKLRSGRRNAIRSIYFAAPPPESTVHRYEISERISQYEEIGSIQNEEIDSIQNEEIDSVQDEVIDVSLQNDLEEADKGEREKEIEGLNAEELVSSEDGYQTPHDYMEVL